MDELALDAVPADVVFVVALAQFLLVLVIVQVFAVRVDLFLPVGEPALAAVLTRFIEIPVLAELGLVLALLKTAIGGVHGGGRVTGLGLLRAGGRTEGEFGRLPCECGEYLRFTSSHMNSNINQLKSGLSIKLIF